MKLLVPSDFDIPLRLEHSRFFLRPLVISDVVKDYDAVMTSVDHLQGTFGPKLSWPSPDLTFEQDLIDLGWHNKEFQLRNSFAYTVMSSDEKQCLGCTYIYSSNRHPYEAEAYCWVRASHADLDPILYEVFRSWLRDSWPFAKVAFPGRDPDWEQWNATAM